MSRKGRKRRSRRVGAIRKNRHHILTRARFPQYSDIDWNKVKVDILQHDAYHQLFAHRTPEEAFEFLIKTFWKGFIQRSDATFTQPF